MTTLLHYAVGQEDEFDQMNKNISFCHLVVFAAITSGCSQKASDVPALGQVTGAVVIDGKPMADVMIKFAPKEGGRPSSGVSDANGRFRLVYSSTETGAKLGTHKVSISSYSNVDMNDPNAPMMAPQGNVPKKYESLFKEIDVKAGKNDIELKFP